MNLQQIKYFLAVVDMGTFLGASDYVHVSQPTLSTGIKKLEESLGVKLFYRGSRKATLTPDGDFFLHHARSIYSEIELVKNKLSNEKTVITIGVINTIPMTFLEEVITLHKKLYPTVLYEIEVGNINYLHHLILQRKLDLLFTTKLNIEMEFHSLFDEELKLVVSNKSFLSVHDVVSVTQIHNHTFIERTHCESWHEVHAMFKRYKINLQTICRAESDESILPLVESNLGISIMPYRRTPYNVKFINIKELPVKRILGMYFYNSSLADSFSNTAQIVYKNKWIKQE